MSTPPPDTPSAAPRWKPLDARQRRVLGVLIEKAKTTPAGYPMSVNAVVTGCNPKNNRDPLMTLDDIDVSNALVELGELGVVKEVDWIGRVPKYKHLAYEWLGVSKVELAVLAELLLRGAQAQGELRGRAARMEPIADLAALKPVVDALVARGLMIEITPPGRGQIVSHNLYPPPELVEVRSRHAEHGVRDLPGETQAPGPHAPRQIPAQGAPPGPAVDRVARLAAELADLRAEVVRLRDRVAGLEAKRVAPAGPLEVPPAGEDP